MISIDTCPNCGSPYKNAISRLGIVEENSIDIYGHWCLKCGFFIRPTREPEIVVLNKMKMEELRHQMRQKMRQRLFGTESKNGNQTR